MERTNAQKKPKKRKKSSNKPQQKQSQKQSVVVNIADAVRRRKKSSASKSKATPMPSSQQFAQQQPQFIYATQPPVQQNPLNPSVAVPTQERQFIPLEPPPLVTRTTQATCFQFGTTTTTTSSRSRTNEIFAISTKTTTNVASGISRR
jgi:hypothetical protein